MASDYFEEKSIKKVIRGYEDLSNDTPLLLALKGTRYICLNTGKFVSFYDRTKINRRFEPVEPSKRTGFKIHINVQAEQVKKAFDCLVTHLTGKKSPVVEFKVSHIDALVKIKENFCELRDSILDLDDIKKIDFLNSEAIDGQELKDMVSNIAGMFNSRVTPAGILKKLKRLSDHDKNIFKLALQHFFSETVNSFSRCIENCQFTIYIMTNTSEAAYYTFFREIEAILYANKIIPSCIAVKNDQTLGAYISGRYDGVTTSTDTYLSPSDAGVMDVPECNLFKRLREAREHRSEFFSSLRKLVGQTSFWRSQTFFHRTLPDTVGKIQDVLATDESADQKANRLCFLAGKKKPHLTRTDLTSTLIGALISEDINTVNGLLKRSKSR